MLSPQWLWLLSKIPGLSSFSFSESGILATFHFSPIAIIFVEKPQIVCKYPIHWIHSLSPLDFWSFIKLLKINLAQVSAEMQTKEISVQLNVDFCQSPRVQHWKRLLIICSRKLRTVDDANCLGKLQKIYICLIHSSTFFCKAIFLYFWNVCWSFDVINCKHYELKMSVENSDGEKFCQGEPSEVKKLIRAGMKYRKKILVRYRIWWNLWYDEL